MAEAKIKPEDEVVPQTQDEAKAEKEKVEAPEIFDPFSDTEQPSYEIKKAAQEHQLQYQRDDAVRMKREAEKAERQDEENARAAKAKADRISKLAKS